MENIEKLIFDCSNSSGYFFKYISANDTGTTGAHQAGFYMPRDVWPLFFNEAGKKGENKDSWINIHWEHGIETQSRFIWYGKGTRAEYRLTNGFTFLTDDNVGDVLVLSKQDKENFNGYLLSDEESIDNFFASLNISPNDTCKLLKHEYFTEGALEEIFKKWILSLTVGFPESRIISNKSREFFSATNEIKNIKVDDLLLKWIDTEYSLFRCIESDRYKEYISTPFKSVEDLVKVANTILNRRKSRAGHSLENHLSCIFDSNNIPYSSQPVTEQNKKPDFIFPNIELYHKIEFPGDEITFLAVKTTCKDRWRQILNEADKVKIKYLFTLQQGISLKQLKEMDKYNVKLVVPEKYRQDYPKEFIPKIDNLDMYIKFLTVKHVG